MESELPFKFHRWYGKVRKKYVERYPDLTEKDRINRAFSAWLEEGPAKK